MTRMILALALASFLLPGSALAQTNINVTCNVDPNSVPCAGNVDMGPRETWILTGQCNGKQAVKLDCPIAQEPVECTPVTADSCKCYNNADGYNGVDYSITCK